MARAQAPRHGAPASQADAGWVPPLEIQTSTRNLKALWPPLPESFKDTLAALPVSNELPEGFDAAVVAFEAWVKLLLLDAMQRMGIFTQPGQVESKPNSFFEPRLRGAVMAFKQ